MKYERLTKQNQEPKTIFCFSGSMQDFKIYKRLQKLEDKIENGELVEIPPLISYNEHLEKYEVLSYEINIYVKEYCKTKAEAEKRLEELKNKRL